MQLKKNLIFTYCEFLILGFLQNMLYFWCNGSLRNYCILLNLLFDLYFAGDFLVLNMDSSTNLPSMTNDNYFLFLLFLKYLIKSSFFLTFYGWLVNILMLSSWGLKSWQIHLNFELPVIKFLRLLRLYKIYYCNKYAMFTLFHKYCSQNNFHFVVTIVIINKYLHRWNTLQSNFHHAEHGCDRLLPNLCSRGLWLYCWDFGFNRNIWLHILFYFWGFSFSKSYNSLKAHIFLKFFIKLIILHFKIYRSAIVFCFW